MEILQSTREWTYYSQPGNGHITVNQGMDILQSTREWTYYSQPGNEHITVNQGMEILQSTREWTYYSQKLQTVSTFDVSNKSGKWD
jgi:hypothetical protein